MRILVAYRQTGIMIGQLIEINNRELVIKVGPSHFKMIPNNKLSTSKIALIKETL